ncbi:MAG: response regulator [Phycisphaerales bacterium JB040]
MTTPRTYIPVELKAVVAALVIILAAVGTISWINLERAHGAGRDSLQSLTDGFASSIAVASELPLAVRDLEELDRLLSRYLRSDEVIEFVAIFDEQDHLISSASKGRLEAERLESLLSGATDESDPSRAGFTLGSARVHAIEGGISNVFDDLGFQTPATGTPEDASSSVDASPEILGRVLVGTSRAGLRELRARGIRSAVTTTLVALVLCSIGVTLFVRRWSARLNKLVGATRHIAAGDFTRTLPKDKHDELGILIEAFESMRCSIQERDASDRKQKSLLTEATRLAEEANTAKSQFLAHMSHEIRTPLNGVIGMLELLERTSLHGKQKRFVSVGRSSADALLQLINSILDFSKIEAGQLELESIDFEFREVIETVTEMLATKGQSKGLEVACWVGPEIPARVNGDPSRLRQIVLNLLNNAIKFTEEGEVVVRASAVESSEDSTTVRISVSDTGIGIPKEKRARLFKSFSQVDASTTRRFGGTGLGLAISKNLAELMGGQIGIDEERTQGSEFWFTVVLGHAEDDPGPATLASLGGARVLIVDDNQTNREILIEALSHWNARPVAVDHAHRAVELLRASKEDAEPFGCLLLDMQMPDMDGLQLAELILSDPGIDPLPIVMLSSIAEIADLRELENFGIASYLPKPVRLSMLYEQLVQIVRPSTPARGRDAHDRVRPRGGTDPVRGRTVLIAEDNPVNQMVIQELLQQAGARVEIAGNGRIAVERWSAGGFDAVLMDCEMPVMDGLTATGRIRSLERETGRSRTPIIALTANAVQGDRDRCLSAGMDDYLTKPIDPELLLRTLGSHLPHDAPVPDPETRPDGNTPAGEPASDDGPASIEIESALNRCGGNAGLLLRVFEEYTKAARRDLDRIRALAGGDDLDGVRSAAHAIKGASANISATGASEIAHRIESLARDRRRDGLDEAIASLETELHTVFQDLERARTRLDNLSPSDAHP